MYFLAIIRTGRAKTEKKGINKIRGQSGAVGSDAIAGEDILQGDNALELANIATIDHG